MKLFFASAMLVAMMGGQAASAQPPALASLMKEVPLPLAGEEMPAIVEQAAPQIEEATISIDTPLDDTPLNLDELSDFRGGESVGVQHTTQNLNAINSGNSVTAGESVGSGAVNVNAGAFNGYDGIGNFVINTGHNNNLMGSVSVNVMVTPQ